MIGARMQPAIARLNKPFTVELEVKGQLSVAIPVWPQRGKGLITDQIIVETENCPWLQALNQHPMMRASLLFMLCGAFHENIVDQLLQQRAHTCFLKVGNMRIHLLYVL